MFEFYEFNGYTVGVVIIITLIVYLILYKCFPRKYEKDVTDFKISSY